MRLETVVRACLDSDSNALCLASLRISVDMYKYIKA